MSWQKVTDLGWSRSSVKETGADLPLPLMAFPYVLATLKVFLLPKIPKMRDIKALFRSLSSTSTCKRGRVKKTWMAQWLSGLLTWTATSWIPKILPQKECFSDNVEPGEPWKWFGSLQPTGASVHVLGTAMMLFINQTALNYCPDESNLENPIFWKFSKMVGFYLPNLVQGE